MPDSSFKLYIDAVGSLHAAQAVRLAGHGPSIAFILANLPLYFSEASLDVYGGDSAVAGRRPTRQRVAVIKDEVSVQERGPDGRFTRGRTGRGRGTSASAAPSSPAPGRSAGRGTGRGGR